MRLDARSLSQGDLVPALGAVVQDGIFDRNRSDQNGGDTIPQATT